MKKFLLFALIIVFTFTLVACGGGEQKVEVKQEMQQTASPDTTKLAEGKAICPACGMEMNKTEMLKADIDGQEMYFCNDNCKNHYLTMKEKGEGQKQEGEPEKKSM